MQSQTLIDENAMSTDSVYMAYDTSFQYSYRDDFLMNSAFGNKYIQYYYDLSEFLADESVSIALMLETADLLIDLNHNLEMLIDTTGYSNSIVVDSAMNTSLVDLLIDYRNISSNKEYVDVINDIIYDVNTYSNKTVDYIITDIQ